MHSGTQTDATKATIHIQVEYLLRRTPDQVTIGGFVRAIFWVLQRQVGLPVPAQLLGKHLELKAFDLCLINVFGQRDAANSHGRDHVIDIVLECIGRPTAPAMLAAQSNLKVFRGFSLNIGVTEAGVIQLVKGGSVESRAVTGSKADTVGQRKAITQASCGVLAIGFVIVVAQADLPVMPAGLSQVLCKQTVVIAALFRIADTAADFVFKPVIAKCQQLVIGQMQIILPTEAIALSVIT